MNLRSTMLKLFFLAYLAFTFAACSESSAPTPAPDVKKVVVRDTDVNWERPTDCRANIKTATCVVAPLTKEQENEDTSPTRPCLGGEEKYQAVFESLYDHYPSSLQKMFCSIRHIYIEKEFFATAYAGSVHDKEGKILPGVILGIRKSVIDENLSFPIWSSWKEQLSFGGDSKSYSPQSNLPTYSSTSPGEINFLLYFIIAHEFGHFFDFANNVNEFENCENGTCSAVAEWSKFSWSTMFKAIPAQNFSGREKLCFYRCESFIEKSAIDDLYLGLDKSNFISTYAASNPYDDFAESVAYYAAARNLKAEINLHTNEQTKYDLIQKLNSAQFSSKLDYVDKMFAKKDLRYP